MTYLTKDDRKALADITFGFDYQRRVYDVVEDIVARHVTEADDLADALDDSLEREKALEDKLDKVVLLARECQGLVSRYTRVHGENGDRVADLLSEDTYRIGTALLALLDE